MKINLTELLDRKFGESLPTLADNIKAKNGLTESPSGNLTKELKRAREQMVEATLKAIKNGVNKKQIKEQLTDSNTWLEKWKNTV